MKNSKFVFDRFAKLIEQGLVSSKDITSEILSILKSKRNELVFKLKLKFFRKESRFWKKK